MTRFTEQEKVSQRSLLAEVQSKTQQLNDLKKQALDNNKTEHATAIQAYIDELNYLLTLLEQSKKPTAGSIQNWEIHHSEGFRLFVIDTLRKELVNLNNISKCNKSINSTDLTDQYSEPHTALLLSLERVGIFLLALSIIIAPIPLSIFVLAPLISLIPLSVFLGAVICGVGDELDDRLIAKLDAQEYDADTAKAFDLQIVNVREKASAVANLSMFQYTTFSKDRETKHASAPVLKAGLG